MAYFRITLISTCLTATILRLFLVDSVLYAILLALGCSAYSILLDSHIGWPVKRRLFDDLDQFGESLQWGALRVAQAQCRTLRSLKLILYLILFFAIGPLSISVLKSLLQRVEFNAYVMQNIKWIATLGVLLAFFSLGILIDLFCVFVYRTEIRQSLKRQLLSLSRNHCGECGYDLRGNESKVCPECGTPLSDANLQLLATKSLAGSGCDHAELSVAIQTAQRELNRPFFRNVKKALNLLTSFLEYKQVAGVDEQASNVLLSSTRRLAGDCRRWMGDAVGAAEMYREALSFSKLGGFSHYYAVVVLKHHLADHYRDAWQSLEFYRSWYRNLSIFQWLKLEATLWTLIVVDLHFLRFEFWKCLPITASSLMKQLESRLVAEQPSAPKIPNLKTSDI